MSRVHRTGLHADLRRGNRRRKRTCYSAPAAPTGVTLAFGKREVKEREEWRAVTTWTAVTQDTAGRSINVAAYEVEWRATDASGGPVELDGGQPAVWRQRLEADDGTRAVHAPIMRPRTWYLQTRVRAARRVAGRLCWGAWAAWTTPVQPATGALPGPPVPTGLTLSFDRAESRRGSPWILVATWNEVPQWTPADGDRVDGASRYDLRLEVRPAGGTVATNVRRVSVAARDQDSDPTARCTFTSISRKREYRAQVRAVDIYGRKGAWSGWTAWSRPPALTAPVANLSWSHPKPRLYVARWDPPTGDDADAVIGYRVRVYRGAAPGTLVETADVTNTRYRYEVPKADKAKKHYVEVRALYEASVEEGNPTTSADITEGETWPASDVDLADLGQQLASGGHVSDGTPPASSPTPAVRGAIGALVVSWPAVSNADPVTYEVHVSATSGFTPSPATKALETAGTYAWVRRLADDTPLEAGTTYYVKVVAKDLDGTAAPSAQASGQVAQVTSPDIATDQVLANHIAAGQISAEHLAAVELAASGLIRAGAAAGQHVDVTPDGVTLYASDGTILVRLPTSSDETPYFAGQIVAQALTVLGATLLADTSVGREAALVLERQVTNPRQAPTLAVGWQSVDLGTSASGSRRGLAYTASGGSGGTTPVWWFGAGSYVHECTAATPGSVNRSILTGVYDVRGVAIVGTTLYVLVWSSSVFKWYIRRYNLQTLAYLGSWDVTSHVSYSAALGANGTELLLVDRNVSQQGPENITFRRLDASTGASIQLIDSGYAPGGIGSAIAPTGVWTRDDGSGTRWWVSMVDSVLGSPFDVQVFTTAGVRQANEAFPTDRPWGIAHDGTGFHTLGSGASSDRRLTKHSNWVWTTESSKYWVAYTWYDNVGLYETSISPKVAVTMKRRAYLTVTWPQRPNGANRTRVYAERGDTEPVTLRRQATVSTASTQLASFNASGAAPPASNSFPGSGHGAEVRTSDGAPLIRADGMSRCRVVRGTTQSIPSNSATVVTYASGNVQVDTDNYAEPANSRWRVPWAGQYLVQFGGRWAANATGVRRLLLQSSTDGVNWAGLDAEGARDDRTAPSGSPVQQSVAVTLQLAAGTYLRVHAFQNSGGALDLVSLNLSIVFLGPA